MPVTAQTLPPARSVYDYPITIPGQELTPAQVEQANIAKIAGIVTAVAAGKKALTDAVTMQVVALLRAADFTTEAGVKLFARQAATIVRMGIRQSQIVTWAGVRERSAIMGVPLPGAVPDESEYPPEVRATRGSELEEAYERLANEYKKNRELKPDSAPIKTLVKEFESQGLLPIARPERISEDAVEPDGKYDETWKKAFAKAEQEARKEEGRANPKRPRTSTPIKVAPRGGAALGTVEPAVDEPTGGSRDVDEDVRGTNKDSAGTSRVEEPQALVTLTPAEVDRVIERYAEQKVEERAERMVSHDIQSASRNTHHVAMEKLPKSKVVGYRRIVHPELSESGQSCGLCIVASTNMYSRGDLMPIHNLCNCEVAEVYKVGDQLFDPGRLINMEDLEVFYNEAAGSTRGFDLKRSRYKVIDHPEYGRSLVNVNEKASLEAIEFGP